ncbi:MAG: hypothetical protein JWQ42_2292 [Edaphobacter sp.]|nr:hypothetical protein [Edaphobacter sp.]
MLNALLDHPLQHDVGASAAGASSADAAVATDESSPSNLVILPVRYKTPQYDLRYLAACGNEELCTSDDSPN